jgi:small conductance mechanosensitive channel
MGGFMLNAFSNINLETIVDTYLIPWSINIAMAVAIFIVGKFATGLIVRISKKLMGRAGVDQILVNFISSIVKTALYLFIAIAALDQLGVNTTSLVALIAGAGLAVGLALQGSLQNLASGVMLIVFRPFTAGDFIEAAGLLGVVETIGIFSITMRTGDNREIIVPNSDVYGKNITNYSKRATRRIDMVFGIGYDDDIRKAKGLIKEILDADPRVHAEPAPLIAVAELAESSVNINVRPWCDTGEYWNIFFDMQEKIKLAFDENGISIPYPQMDVHQKNAA